MAVENMAAVEARNSHNLHTLLQLRSQLRFSGLVVWLVAVTKRRRALQLSGEEILRRVES